MATIGWSNNLLSQIMDETAWKELSGNFPWNEQLLEKYQAKVDWKEVSANDSVLWTASMLERFKNELNWDALSCSSHRCILVADLFERFKDRWNWHLLSGNCDVDMDYEIIDRFVDRWDWEALINRYCEDKLFDQAFLERYREYIPASTLKDSRLWQQIIEQRTWQLARKITA